MLHDVVQRKKFYTLVLQKCLTRSNNTETETLSNILINNYGENEICFGVSVLLKSKPQADLYWNKLDEETKERYLDYPIYNLFQKL